MSRIKVIFFDAAGTLFHVKGSVAEIYLAYAEPYGVRRTPELLEAVNAAFQRAFHDAPPPIFAVTEPAEIKRCERLWWFDIVHNVFYRVGMFEWFDDYFDKVFQAFDGPQHWVLYPETLGVLKALKGQGFELGIISNFDTRLFNVLRSLGLTDLFDTVTISSLAKAAKPASQIFQLALEKHAVDPEEALHVGDSVREDLEGARRAGLAGLLIDRRQAGPVPGVGPTIRSLEELPSFIASL
ncbi:MAG: HAD-IA family hydrolase [Nitrospirae bacterium]|nr:HAD-IA family hydrolase [Nitrospirota bacterium]